MSAYRIEGTVALVTGAGRRLGRAMAQARGGGFGGHRRPDPVELSE
jgi:NAD(P)-dependent dehydrogenase (short-subunit alcohol dehydrogenase family)